MQLNGLHKMVVGEEQLWFGGAAYDSIVFEYQTNAFCYYWQQFVDVACRGILELEE